MTLNKGNIKTGLGLQSLYQTVDTFQYMRIGEVVSVEDDKSLGRIQVKLTGTDNIVSENEVSYCYPLLPKHLLVQPKKGEAVIVFIYSREKQYTDRFYIGPITSQSDKLIKDDYGTSALAGLSIGPQAANVNFKRIPEITGVFPDEQDISIQGRYNTDITQKENEILLRAGKFVTSSPSSDNIYNFKFNKKTQAYIQIKNEVFTNKEKTTKGTVTNIVANKINLLTHADGSPSFDLTNQTNLIDDDTLAKILSSPSEGGAHPLPFGDVLITYLRLLKDALFYHVHNGSGNPATDLTISGNKQALAAFKKQADDLERRMLSNNIRIN